MKINAKTVDIPNGEIEYCLGGNGPTVLISHGTLGGCDQGYAISKLFNDDIFSFLCVSRAGYLNSSSSTGRTPNEQARSYKQLLDREDIPSVAILGISGGAPAALRFAQDYPERCWALILMSSIIKTPPLPPFFKIVIQLQDFMMRIDPLWAFVHRFGLKLLMRSNGVRSEQANEIFKDPHLRKVTQGIFEPIKTSSLRRKGLQLDDAQIKSLPPIESYDIRVPTYISHSANDPLAPSVDAAQLASSIPNAEYHEVSDGGHIFFVVHSKNLIPKVEQFLLKNVPK